LEIVPNRDVSRLNKDGETGDIVSEIALLKRCNLSTAQVEGSLLFSK